MAENVLQIAINRFYPPIEGTNLTEGCVSKDNEVLCIFGDDCPVVFQHLSTATRGPSLRNKVERFGVT